jgi:hypothetical protein
VSGAAVAVALLILAAGVVWGCVVDYMRQLGDRRDHDADTDDHHRAYMREIRRHQ